ncbi:hypothetical protein ATCC90586_011937 [Pythium insidiosum]|nr:hypothetical protein ATCC90586_011937 [Pythium insidiosum]
MANFGMWSESERCKNLELYLRGAAEAWYQQLVSARRRWSTLAEAFTAEFCVSRQSEAERYFTMKQRKGETAREHLWRLNAAARKARIPLSTPEDLRHHVSRFIKSLADSEIRVALVGRTFRSLEELERGLRAYEEHAIGVGEDRRPSHRERSLSSARSERDRTMPRGSEQTYWAYEDDVSSVEDGEPKSQKTVRFADLEDDPDDADELVYQAVASERRFPGARSPASPKPNTARTSGDQRTRRDASPRRESNCFGCGGAGNWFAEC